VVATTSLVVLGVQDSSQAAIRPPAPPAAASSAAPSRSATGTSSAAESADGSSYEAASAEGTAKAVTTPDTASAKAAATGPADFAPVCAAPAKGDFTCFALRRTDVESAKGLQAAAVAPAGYGASDLRSAYNLPADGGSGQTIAIVDAFDDPYVESDLAVYRAQYGLPACTTANGCFTKVSQRGGTDYPAADQGWAGEISLDVDMVSAAAPDAHILLVEADNDGFVNLGEAVDEAVALGAKYVSNSYGSDYSKGPGEDPTEGSALDPYYNHPGVAIVASSGDHGFGVAYPAASQYVTSVGGTSLVAAPGTARGWSESVWDNSSGGTGSGCSAYEPKPAFQRDTGCANRTSTDVSADADPSTGVSVYQTYGASGWSVYGGTSAASPLIAGVYADAGTPVAGTYPNSYPYNNPTSGLNDVTTGSNGYCPPDTYLCTAGAGYDAPTGLGTPNGDASFRFPPHGELSGIVTDSATGKPVAGAAITVGTQTTQTAADGTYSLSTPIGTYDVDVSAFGYASGKDPSVSVGENASVTVDIALDELASKAVSGTVTDASGHGWPLYAKITIDGASQPVWTNPKTGAYSVKLPKGHSYTLHVSSVYPGYQEVTKTVTMAETAQTLDIPVPADAAAATGTPGYAATDPGTTETFESTTSAPQGWDVVNADGTQGGWAFDDPGNRGNQTGGDGGFAIVDSDYYGPGADQDTQLVSPVYDFTDDASPNLSFDTLYYAYPGQSATVDATDDGGATWTTVWSATTDLNTAAIELPLTAYGGKAAVQLRFHFTSEWGTRWSIDNVFVGNQVLTPVPGSMVIGNVTDANTGSPLINAVVRNAATPDHSAVTIATPEDPNLADGFYSLFAPAGTDTLTALSDDYSDLSKKATATADGILQTNFKLQAGRLAVSQASISGSAVLGAVNTQSVTVTNTGGAAATLSVGEQAAAPASSSTGTTGATAATGAGAGAPLQQVKGDYSPLSLAPKASPAKAAAGASAESATAAPAASGTAWQVAPDLPVPVEDNAVDTYDGKVYSAFGYSDTATNAGTTSALYALDPAAQIWNRLADAPVPKEAAAHGFIGGKLYAAGGWGANSSTLSADLDIYDPASNTWTTGAPEPDPVAAAGTAVLDGKLYSVGGCTVSACGLTNVSAYDADTGTWLQMAPYPEPIAWESCAGISGKLYCAGGTVTDADNESDQYNGFVFDPVTDSWSPIANMPLGLWGSATSSVNGLLLMSTGVTQGAITNQGFVYNPVSNSWAALPNANEAVYRAGGGAGFYKVGGDDSSSSVSTTELLPGYQQAGPTDVDWLSENTQQVTLQPGASTTLTITMDSSVITQPGDYSARLTLATDTPYQSAPIPVAFDVTPPKGWGEITGTVSGLRPDGSTAPIAGATVQIDTSVSDYTVVTAADGTYSLWLDIKDNPLTVIVAMNGYQPATAKVKLTKGAAVTGDFTLKPQ
jgi:N-acetylneuraminic acid mutarotase